MSAQGPTGDLGDRLERLRALLKRLAPGLIAVSGGIDSRLLARVARDSGLPFQVVHFHGPHQSPAEAVQALDGLHELGLPFHVLAASPLDDARARANDRERCYHCKRALFRRAADLARDLSGEGAYLRLLDGSNADDTASFRPGLRALAELGVKSPLAETGLDKAAIRALARCLGLDRPDQPARACLMTRFAYGIAPTPALLDLVGRAEDALHALGLSRLRLRVPRLAPDGAPVFALHLDAAEHARYAAVSGQAEAALAALAVTPTELRFLDTLSGVYDAPA